MHAEALMDGDSPLAHRLTLQLCNFPLPTSHLAAPEVEQIEKGVATWQVVDVRQRQSLRFDFD